MPNNLNDFLRSRASLGFDSFEFGSGMLASIEGSAAHVRATDTLAQVRHAINTGVDRIDPETQAAGYAQMMGGDYDAYKPETGEGYMPEEGKKNLESANSYLSSVVDALPNFGLTDAVKTAVYGLAGISILVVGLIALVLSTDAGKSAAKDAVKAAAV